MGKYNSFLFFFFFSSGFIEVVLQIGNKNKDQRFPNLFVYQTQQGTFLKL